MIARLDDLVTKRTGQILDAAAEKNDVNFVRDVAYALPMHMIGDIIGIPESDRGDVFHWTDLIMRAADPDQAIPPATLQGAQTSLFGYAAQLGEAKRRKPADDVWSILSTVTIDDEDGRSASLTPLELDQFFLILSIAGSETTRNVISSGLLAFLEHPDQADQLHQLRLAQLTQAEDSRQLALPQRFLQPPRHARVSRFGGMIRSGVRRGEKIPKKVLPELACVCI